MKLSVALIVFLSVVPFAQAASDDYFNQPTEVPETRKWKTGAQELPPLADIIARPGQELPVYGIYLWCGEYVMSHKEIEDMGVRSIRLGGPVTGADKALTLAAENDVEVMYTVDNRTIRGRVGGEKWTRASYDSDAAFLEALGDTFTTFLEKYGKDGSLYAGTGLESPVKYVEVLNEPNYQYMIPNREPRKEVEAEREALYAQVLTNMSELIRESPHGMPIVAFACGAGSTAADIRFVRNVYEDAGRSLNADYDVFSTHPYMAGAPPEAYKIMPWGQVSMANNLERVRQILATEGGDKPVWFTEVGWPIAHQLGGTFKDVPNVKNDVIDQDLHGAYMVRMYLWAMRLGVGRVHLMHMFDTDNYNSGIVMRGSLEWRPAAYAIKNITTLLPNPKLTDAQSDGESDSYIYEFIADHTKGDDATVTVAWNVAGSKQVSIDVDCPGDEVTVYDMAGNEKQFPVKGGKLQLEIGPYPLYIANQ